MNLLIIGSDSYIAQHFISRYNSIFNLTNISRVASKCIHEIIVPDLFQIPDEIFNDKSVVLNFAAIVHQPDNKEANIYDKINFRLSLHNAQKSKNGGVKLFIQMSSIAVYGNATNISVDSEPNPLDHYGKSKLKADEELLKLQNETFKVTLIRSPMVYGGGGAPGNMMRLIKLVDKGVPLPFKGINNSRDFININNLVQYLRIISEMQLYGIFLISDNEPVSTQSLVQVISKYFLKKAPLIKIPKLILIVLKTFFPKEYTKVYGSLKIQTNFCYENLINRYSIEQGIHEMVLFYRNNLNREE